MALYLDNCFFSNNTKVYKKQKTTAPIMQLKEKPTKSMLSVF